MSAEIFPASKKKILQPAVPITFVWLCFAFVQLSIRMDDNKVGYGRSTDQQPNYQRRTRANRRRDQMNFIICVTRGSSLDLVFLPSGEVTLDGRVVYGLTVHFAQRERFLFAIPPDDNLLTVIRHRAESGECFGSHISLYRYTG